MDRLPGASSYPPLTLDQQATVEANTGLVGFVLNRARVPSSEWEDRFQDGIFGLARAVQLFDESRGFQFSTYALYWIRQSIGRGRELEGGKNLRSAARRGDDYTQPLSLDAQVHDEDHLSLGSLLAAVDDPAGEAVADVWLTEVLGHLDDPLDRQLVGALAAGASQVGAARQLGIDRPMLQSRMRIIRQRLARHRVA